jgi:2',3'-cyclic-nucleotide 2'-phosphodiesterase/3'-nucleotidase
MRFVVERKEIAPRAAGSWSLVPPRDAAATFLTGPGASAHSPAGIRVEPAGEGPDGFAKYRIVG